jgi:hypothetical protein
MLCVSRKTLWRLVSSGQLPVVYLDRRPRFLLEDVWGFVQSRRVLGARQVLKHEMELAGVRQLVGER